MDDRNATEKMKQIKDTESPFMGTKEASALWGVSQSTISRWCREDKIDADQDDYGSPWRIPRNTIPPMQKKTVTQSLSQLR